MAYFANSTEGGILDAQCSACPLGSKPCPILGVQLMHNYDQCDNPKLKEAMNALIDEKGVCQMRPLLLTVVPDETHVQTESVLDWLANTSSK